MDIGNPGSTIAIRAVANHGFFVAKAVEAGKKSIVTFVRHELRKGCLCGLTDGPTCRSSPAMLKFLTLLLPGAVLLAGCSTAPESASTSAATTSRTSTTTASKTNLSSFSTTSSSQSERAVWVDPPTGSHIGGGFARVPRGSTANNESGLIDSISALNSAETKPQTQPFALRAVSQVSGLSEKQLLSQQNQLRLRIGDLLALNVIARNQPAKVSQLYNQKASGKSWGYLAQQNSIPFATVAQRVREASDLAAGSYVKSATTGSGTELQLRNQGVAPRGQEFGGSPSGR